MFLRHPREQWPFANLFADVDANPDSILFVTRTSQYALHCGMLSVASTQCEGWPPRYSRALYQALSVEPQAYERKNQNKRDTNFPNV
jgi:hypothetical protein